MERENRWNTSISRGGGLALRVSCLLVGMFVLTSCSGGLSEADRQTLAPLEPKVDNLVTGYNDQKYEVFARDFDERMRAGITEAAFTGDFRSRVFDVIGKYVSREPDSVTKPQGRLLVTYRARFEKERSVIMRVFFEPGGDQRITGLFFDSPKLRRQG